MQLGLNPRYLDSLVSAKQLALITVVALNDQLSLQPLVASLCLSNGQIP
jgi:hypothetical protein